MSFLLNRGPPPTGPGGGPPRRPYGGQRKGILEEKASAYCQKCNKVGVLRLVESG